MEHTGFHLYFTHSNTYMFQILEVLISTKFKTFFNKEALGVTSCQNNSMHFKVDTNYGSSSSERKLVCILITDSRLENEHYLQKVTTNCLN